MSVTLRECKEWTRCLSKIRTRLRPYVTFNPCSHRFNSKQFARSLLYSWRMAARPRGYGFSAEAKRKIEAKYDADQEMKAREWIEAVLDEKVFEGKELGIGSAHEVLRSGVILLRVANKLGANLKVNDSKLAFKQMENIGNFLEFMEKYGCARCDLFQTVDLYERQNMPCVIDGIHALGRKACLKNPCMPQLGPKEAEANPRNFTEKQMRARQAIHMP